MQKGLDIEYTVRLGSHMQKGLDTEYTQLEDASPMEEGLDIEYTHSEEVLLCRRS